MIAARVIAKPHSRKASARAIAAETFTI